VSPSGKAAWYYRRRRDYRALGSLCNVDPTTHCPSLPDEDIVLPEGKSHPGRMLSSIGSSQRERRQVSGEQREAALFALSAQ